jgi:hypothetical protein
MITPPFSTPSFYTALLEHDAARFVVGLITTNNAGKDIEQVLITSHDLPSDMHATNELRAGTDEVISHLLDEGEEADTEVHFNPMYLPVLKNDLFDKVELDSDGDITAVDGFGNPFISMALKLSIPDFPGIIDAKVNYKQFELPAMNEMLAQPNLLLS